MKTFDVIIAGAGLAGLATAAQLLDKNNKLKILVYDAKQIGEGASGVPSGMVNPATGQKARIVWKAENCFQMLEERLKILSLNSETSLYLGNGILRPAIDEELAENFKASMNKKHWPKSWLEWLDPETVRKRVPYLKENSGALFIKRGKTVQTPEYLHSYARFLKKSGVSFVMGGPYSLQYDGNWILDNGKAICSAPVLLFTTGFKARENKFWGELPVNSVKGQLAIYRCSVNIEKLPAISAYGYIAPIDHQYIAVGSTYEHHFEDEIPDTHGAALLDQKLEELMPGLYPKCQRVGLWSGIRATTPDRLPIVGEHYEHKKLFVYTGLGSKGLLYSEYVASLLADHILNSSPLPFDISLYRFSKIQELRDQEIEKNQIE